MPSNIEIKARVSDLEALRRVAQELADAPCEVLQQEDVFFRGARGRLKLRMFPGGSGELIHYERPDDAGASQSHYRIFATGDTKTLRAVLADALGELVTVRKTRELWLAGRTRIHLDRVEGLGDFAELEVVLRPGQCPDEGRAVAADLMERLGIRETDLVACAYADLLLHQQESG